MKLLLQNICRHSQGQDRKGDLRIRSGKITAFAESLTPQDDEFIIDLSGYRALPGLINGHDHLELNLLPGLGSPPYPNSYAWARDIYHPEQSPIREILQVPLADRMLWGAYKNLLSGVTTVIHHNKYYPDIFEQDFPVKVLKEYEWSHSIGYGGSIAETFVKSHDTVYIIHAAEGNDCGSFLEIEQLETLRVLGTNTVLVHGIAVSLEQIQRLSQYGASIVWCPSSNLYLYGETAPISQMKAQLRIALGTDSTLSGTAMFLDELRVAYSTGMVTSDELLEMATTSAASIFRLSAGRGTLAQGAPADVVILPDRGGETADMLLKSRPEEISLILVHGEPRLADAHWAERLELGQPNLWLHHTPKWLAGDVYELTDRIERFVGMDILSQHPLYSLISK